MRLRIFFIWYQTMIFTDYGISSFKLPLRLYKWFKMARNIVRFLVVLSFSHWKILHLFFFPKKLKIFSSRTPWTFQVIKVNNYFLKIKKWKNFIWSFVKMKMREKSDFFPTSFHFLKISSVDDLEFLAKKIRKKIFV